MLNWKDLLVVIVLIQGSLSNNQSSTSLGNSTIDVIRNSSLIREDISGIPFTTPTSQSAWQGVAPSNDHNIHNISIISVRNSNTSSELGWTSTATHQHDVFSSIPDDIGLSQGVDSMNQTFLSFNEWRVAKLNQEVLKDEKRTKTPEQLSGYNQESEVMGDDMEIELSFFSNAGAQSEQETEPEGKVYNHKFNFASLDCAATIVKTNSEASGATSILTENKDKYLLNPCSAPNKFIIIELCQDILVEEIAIANFEFFSSTFSKVRFSISDLYPAAKNGWRVLGEFDAEDSRNLQSFPIQNPQIWARYLRIEILSHHDNEFYCPVSLIRVHGKTMMDEFKMENTHESSTGNEETGILEQVADENAEQCINEIIEKCNSWPSIDPNNITYIPDLPDTFSKCQSKLVPLKFEEFLKDLNKTHCLPKNKVNNTSFSPSPSFSTEESIFKNIVKRLTTLESNATLTVLYIEEQSKLLAESFEQLERTQSLKFDNLVSLFNDTIMENLNVLRVFANQLKDQSIRILEEQKLNNDQFTTQNTIKLANLEKELKAQQRILFFISSSLLATLIYVLLQKGSSLERIDDEPVLKTTRGHTVRELPKR